MAQQHNAARTLLCAALPSIFWGIATAAGAADTAAIAEKAKAALAAK